MCWDDCVTRRTFVRGGIAAITGVALGSSGIAQTSLKRALDDPTIIHGAVTFKNGADTIDGYLARPKTEKRSRAVIILHGNLGIPEDHRNTAAQLAQKGYLGLVVSSTSREGLVVDPTNPDAKSQPPDASGITREFAYSYRFIKRYMQDAQSGIEYLKSRPFFQPAGVGLIGFCGGGITALTFATVSPDLRAVIEFYASPISHPPDVSLTDPRPDPIALVDRIKLPVQCHYGTKDDLIPVEDIKKFQQVMRAHKAPAQVYIYEGAHHAFYDYTRPALYDPEAARLAQGRTLRFLNEHLK